MIYTSTSIQDVIRRVISATGEGVVPYIGRMNEWIPEAMGYMRTKVTLQPCWQRVPIQFHRGRLPCGLRSLLAVEINGQRVPHYNGTRALTAPAPAQVPVTPTLFGTEIVSRETPEGGLITETQLHQVNNLPISSEAYYYTELDWINLSFSEGCVIVHYNRIPLDAQGFPLIPDNENYKEAIYWYCRAKVIGLGFKDPVFHYDDCEARFEKHAARAMGQIRYPSVDQVQSRLEAQQRFILPEDWYHNFFTPLKEEGTI